MLGESRIPLRIWTLLSQASVGIDLEVVGTKGLRSVVNVVAVLVTSWPYILEQSYQGRGILLWSQEQINSVWTHIKRLFSKYSIIILSISSLLLK